MYLPRFLNGCHECIEKLEVDGMCSVSSNRSLDVLSNYDHLQYMCIRRYFDYTKDGMSKMQASEFACLVLNKTPKDYLSLGVSESGLNFIPNMVDYPSVCLSVSVSLSVSVCLFVSVSLSLCLSSFSSNGFYFLNCQLVPE